MDSIERIITPVALATETELDRTLRPQHFSDFIGQEKLKQNLSIFVAASKKRGEPLDHVLFSGPPGLGKTTLARILANEMGVSVTTTSGPVLEKKGDLAGNLTGLAPKELFFIDEIHRLNRVVEEALYPAIEDFVFDIMTGEGPAAKSIRLPLNPFTLVGATTRAGLITSPMLARFGYVGRLEYYTPEEMQRVVIRSAKLLGIACDPSAALELGKRSRGTPRVANRLLRRTRDVADVRGDGTITSQIVLETCTMLGIDSSGLDEMDKAILLTIIENYGGGPVGIKNIAVVVGEETDTIEDVYEPYLIQAGFLHRTPQGRAVTQKAYDYFGIVPKTKKSAPISQLNLFGDIE